MKMIRRHLTLFSFYSLLFYVVESRNSMWNMKFTDKNMGAFYIFPNYLYNQSFASVGIYCTPNNHQNTTLKVTWVLEEIVCMEDMYQSPTEVRNRTRSQHPPCNIGSLSTDTTAIELASLLLYEQQYGNGKGLAKYGDLKEVNYDPKPLLSKHFMGRKFQMGYDEVDCGVVRLADRSNESYYQAILPQIPDNCDKPLPSPHFYKINRQPDANLIQFNRRVSRVWADGMYHLQLSIRPVDPLMTYTADVTVELRSVTSFIPANIWPLFPYSIIMSTCYLVITSVWMALWYRSNIHTTPVHIVISAVAVAGAMTNTFLFMDMTSLNQYGTGINGILWMQRIFSCVQNSLSQLLLMVMCTGYKISRPHLSSFIKFTTCTLAISSFVTNMAVFIVLDESLRLKYTTPILYQAVTPIYALVLVFIGAWIMMWSIVTFMHLVKRQHAQKCKVFCLFMASCILAFAVLLVMVGFGFGIFTSCRTDWKHEWIVSHFEHMENFVLLIMLMWLWRPVDEAQSYAFHPLNTEENNLGLDDDDDDDVQYDKTCLEMADIPNGKTG